MKHFTVFAKRVPVLALAGLMSTVTTTSVHSQDFGGPSASSYTYNKEWAIVSAPPPPGPYQPVNVDPRVPGQDIIPPFTTSLDQSAPYGGGQRGYPSPPAAGMPGARPGAAGFSGQQPYGYSRSPGSYTPQMGADNRGAYMMPPPGAGMATQQRAAPAYPDRQPQYGYSQQGYYQPPAERDMPGSYRLPPPGAGIPATEPLQPGSAAQQQPYGYTNPPAGYTPPYGYDRGYQEPGAYFSAPGPYPGGGYAPTPWASATEEEVPPPPVFDSMNRQPPGPSEYRGGIR